ncbi:meiosis-specific topoisomerase Spo11 [Pyricularia oryzae 70-15]|uniref:Meiosis-specific topoisomerase Spo11 n=1 Tax=Pyricularia oryzae (strain 70-15 / ATCC MYA-4617 / FGSC 8958) TaxID=242507 RepID=G4MS23_PYRO7|nr:meiosis-specific topoisomerase Spo11 [Pyricularia oryzae 70-15]EHA57489.1 meiosis-specific topoisomerase Spo11 [Pyricularia oryzae 70-15]
MLRHSERVRRPSRRLLLSSVPMESQVQARSQNARASDGRQELTGKYQGSGHPDAQERSPSAGWFVEHSNNCVQQQAISHAASPPPSNADSQPVTVISRIEAIFESIAADIQQRRELSIPYCRVRGTRDSNSQLRFPGRSVSEARSFGKIPLLNPRRHSTFLRVVFKLSCFRSPGAMRPRDFASGSYNRQSCDEKTAAGKGLIIGPISFVLNGGARVCCDNVRTEGTIICSTEILGRFEFPSARWVLIIEKEATFRTLASSQFYRNSRAGPGVMVTGKGYPDLSTRNLVYCLREARPRIPIYSLVDYDPDGIRILCTYKYSSSALEHERQSAVSNIQWIGIRLSDIKEHHLRPCNSVLQDAGSPVNTEIHSGLDVGHVRNRPDFAMSRQNAFEANTSQLTTRDRKLAHELVSKLSGSLETRGEHDKYLRELRVMLMLNVKAEIQAVDNLGDITEWLDKKLCSQLTNA